MTGIPLFIIIPSDFALLAKGGQRDCDSDDSSDSLSQSTGSLSSSASTRWMSNEVHRQEVPKPITRAPPRRPQRHCSQKSISKEVLSDIHGAAKLDLHDSSPKLPRRSWNQSRSDLEETIVTEPQFELASQEPTGGSRRMSEPVIRPLSSMTAAMAA